MNFKKIFTCAFVGMALCAGFTACNDDEEVAPAPDNQDTVVVEKPVVTAPYLVWQADSSAVMRANAGRTICYKDAEDGEIILGYWGTEKELETIFWFYIDEEFGLYETDHYYLTEDMKLNEICNMLEANGYEEIEIEDETAKFYADEKFETVAIVDKDRLEIPVEEGDSVVEKVLDFNVVEYANADYLLGDEEEENEQPATRAAALKMANIVKAHKARRAVAIIKK